MQRVNLQVLSIFSSFGISFESHLNAKGKLASM